MAKKAIEKTSIGVGHMVRAMQQAGFGHEEIIEMREAMITGNFKGVRFTKDIFTQGWDDEYRIEEQS